MITEKYVTTEFRKQHALDDIANLKEYLRDCINDVIETTDLTDPVDIADSMVFLEVYDSVLNHLAFMEEHYGVV